MRRSKLEGEPPWEEYYKKFDPKLVDLFRQVYDEGKVAYYRVKCSKSVEDGLRIYREHVDESNKIMDKITALAPTSESMPRELIRGVLFREPQCGGNVDIGQLIRMPKEQRSEYRKRKRIEWIIKITSEVAEKDSQELERLERAQKQRSDE